MISSTTVWVRYVGSGSTAVYSYGDRVFANTDLLVKVRLIASPYTETTLVLGTDYTVGQIGQSTGNITLINASQAWLDGSGFLTSSYVLVCKRVRPLTQTTSIRNLGPYYAATHEDTFDNLTMLAQQIDEAIQRSVKLPDTYSKSDFDPHLPAAIIGQLGVSVITDSSTGKTLVVGPTADQISGAQASAVAAAASASSSASSATAAAASAASAAALAARAGVVSIGSGASFVAVTYSSALAVAGVPVISLINTADASPIFLQCVVTAFSTTGFTAAFSAPTDTVNYQLSYQTSGAH